MDEAVSKATSTWEHTRLNKTIKCRNGEISLTNVSWKMSNDRSKTYDAYWIEVR